MATGTSTRSSKFISDSKIFKGSIHIVFSTGKIIAKIWLPFYFMGCVRFARYCGKTAISFAYGGLRHVLDYLKYLFV